MNSIPSSFMRTLCVGSLMVLLLWPGGLFGEEETSSHSHIELVAGEEGFTIRAGDEVLASYLFDTRLGPIFHPVNAPGGHLLVRPYPPREGYDHPHHRSLWISHGKVNGHDFWHGPDKIHHRELVEHRSGDGEAVAVTTNDWVAAGGDIVCTDERTYRVSMPSPDYWQLDIDVTLHAPNGDVTFQDDKEGFLAVRMLPELRARSPGGGTILNSEGDRDRDAWAKRAKWCSYFGPAGAGDEIVGVTIFDHPGNAQHPSWWHVRDYGLFAVNPFGAHAFGNLPENSGDITLPAGGSISFRYRLAFHRGSPESLDLEQIFQDFSQRAP